MIERRCRPRLKLETFQGLMIAGHLSRKKLQGNVASQLEIFRFLDNAHPPAPDLTHNPVV